MVPAWKSQFLGKYTRARMIMSVVKNVAGITSVLSIIYMIVHHCAALD